jgi:Methyltransferase domain
MMVVPWYLKIPAKLVLARLPIPRPFLNRLGVFRHGSMVRADYALEIVTRHAALAGIQWAGLSVLELGPGDSVGNGIIAYALGAERSVLVDAGAWATREPQIYAQFIGTLRALLPDTKRLDSAAERWRTFDELLDAFNISYLTSGLESLQSLPAHSIDYCFSEAVLEHIRVAEFDQSMVELHRIVRPNSVSTHVIDYKDHLQAGLNNMRFSARTWESALFVRSGFYTNRLRHRDVKGSLSKAGWKVLSDSPTLWPEVPIDRKAIHGELQRYTHDELRVRESAILLRA